jgi:DNA-binding MarR family transcriptional regulator
MSHAATNWAIRQKGLKPATKVVLWFLSDCHNGHTGQCNPRQDTLADECEMSRSTVNLHLAKLEELGLIKRIPKIDPKTNRQRATDYILLMDGAEKSASENKTQPQDVVGAASENDTRPVSEKSDKPCPKKPASRVLNSDSMNLGKEPGKEPYPQPPKRGRKRDGPTFGVDKNLKQRLIEGANQ